MSKRPIQLKEPKYRTVKIKMPESMYLYLEETAERSGASVSSLVQQAVRAMRRVFESDYRSKNKGG